MYEAGFDESFGRVLEDYVVEDYVVEDSIQTLKNFKNVFRKIIRRIEKLENAICDNVDVKISVDREIASIIVMGKNEDLEKLMNYKNISNYCEFME